MVHILCYSSYSNCGTAHSLLLPLINSWVDISITSSPRTSPGRSWSLFTATPAFSPVQVLSWEPLTRDTQHNLPCLHAEPTPQRWSAKPKEQRSVGEEALSACCCLTACCLPVTHTHACTHKHTHAHTHMQYTHTHTQQVTGLGPH